MTKFSFREWRAQQDLYYVFILKYKEGKEEYIIAIGKTVSRAAIFLGEKLKKEGQYNSLDIYDTNQVFATEESAKEYINSLKETVQTNINYCYTFLRN